MQNPLSIFSKSPSPNIQNHLHQIPLSKNFSTHHHAPSYSSSSPSSSRSSSVSSHQISLNTSSSSLQDPLIHSSSESKSSSSAESTSSAADNASLRRSTRTRTKSALAIESEEAEREFLRVENDDSGDEGDSIDGLTKKRKREEDEEGFDSEKKRKFLDGDLNRTSTSNTHPNSNPTISNPLSNSYISSYPPTPFPPTSNTSSPFAQPQYSNPQFPANQSHHSTYASPTSLSSQRPLSNLNPAVSHPANVAMSPFAKSNSPAPRPPSVIQQQQQQVQMNVNPSSYNPTSDHPSQGQQQSQSHQLANLPPIPTLVHAKGEIKSKFSQVRQNRKLVVREIVTTVLELGKVLISMVESSNSQNSPVPSSSKEEREKISVDISKVLEIWTWAEKLEQSKPEAGGVIEKLGFPTELLKLLEQGSGNERVKMGLEKLRDLNRKCEEAEYQEKILKEKHGMLVAMVKKMQGPAGVGHQNQGQGSTPLPPSQVNGLQQQQAQPTLQPQVQPQAQLPLNNQVLHPQQQLPQQQPQFNTQPQAQHPYFTSQQYTPSAPTQIPPPPRPPSQSILQTQVQHSPPLSSFNTLPPAPSLTPASSSHLPTPVATTASTPAPPSPSPATGKPAPKKRGRKSNAEKAAMAREKEREEKAREEEERRGSLGSGGAGVGMGGAGNPGGGGVGGGNGNGNGNGGQKKPGASIVNTLPDGLSEEILNEQSFLKAKGELEHLDRILNSQGGGTGGNLELRKKLEDAREKLRRDLREWENKTQQQGRGGQPTTGQLQGMRVESFTNLYGMGHQQQQSIQQQQRIGGGMVQNHQPIVQQQLPQAQQQQPPQFQNPFSTPFQSLPRPPSQPQPIQPIQPQQQNQFTPQQQFQLQQQFQQQQQQQQQFGGLMGGGVNPLMQLLNQNRMGWM